ncbi:hypothetical protein HNR46_000006 [Haloferula luteola]|uniref:Uncharacterized protein n=1 Tax=Haloferula luteola TaxID=595692 RepID=A0A840UVP3_9BACT|nr:hypothetical protein [Haloferula luteola]
MQEWTKERIRKETSWEAFKRGEALVAAGKIPEMTERQGILVGLFIEGRTKIRTTVKTRGVLEVVCSCRENRTTGGVCAHAVAMLLSRLAEKSPAARVQPKTEPRRAPAKLRAVAVQFLPRWQRALTAGALSVQIQWDEAMPEEGESALTRWWDQWGSGAPSAHPLHLKGEVLGAFLRALRTHPRVLSAEGPLESGGVEPLHLLDSQWTDQGLQLRGEPVARHLVQVPGWMGWIEGLSWGGLDEENFDASTVDRLRGLLESGRALVPRARIQQELQAWLDLSSEPRPGWLGSLRLETAPPRVEIHIEGSLNALDARILVEPPEASSPESGRWITEEPGHRENLLEALRGQGFAPRESDLWVIREPEEAVSFLANELDRWKSRWDLRIGSKLSHVLQSLHVIRPVVAPVEGGRLSVDISFQTGGGKTIPRAKVLELIRSGRVSNRTSSGAQVVVAREVFEDFEPLAAELGIAGPEGRVALSPAQFIGLQSRQGTSSGQPWRAPQYPALHELNGVSLRDYQTEGVAWLADRLEALGGALLGDEMGLGKTLQTIGVMKLLRSKKAGWKALVVVPSSLLANWEEEVARFAPGLRVVRLHGADRDERRNQPADVFLTSYATLVRDLAFHRQADYDLMVLDEAGAIRNPTSETAKTVVKIPAHYRLALSGTPVENRLLDLWSIFRFVSPGYLGSREDFSGRYDGQGGSSKRLASRIAPFFLRRTKAQVAADLPGKSFADVVLELAPKDRAIYQEIAQAGLSKMEEMKEEGAARMHLLTVLLRLRQFCLSPELLQPDWAVGEKVHWLKEFLEARADQGKKTLVFSQFSQFLKKIQPRLSEDSGRIFHLDGSTTQRGEVVKAFQNHGGPAVFLISLKAGGYGLNLTAADAVVHMDPWWNPAAESQANDRAHRIGQTLPVSIYRLLMRDSVEERVRRLQNSKQSLIEGVNGGEQGTGWSAEDLRGLLLGSDTMGPGRG